MSLAKFNNERVFTYNTEGLEFKKLSEAGDTTKLSVKGFFFTVGKFGKVPVLISNNALYNLPNYMNEQIEKIIADNDAVELINKGNETCTVVKFHSDTFNTDSYKIVFD